MCEMNASRERLAAVSKERDALRKLNEALEQKCAALEPLVKIEAQNYKLLNAAYTDLQKERDELKRDYEALRAAYIETAKERDNVRECLNRLTNPGPEEAPTRSDILDLAKRCVVGDREQDYGSPSRTSSGSPRCGRPTWSASAATLTCASCPRTWPPCWPC